MYLKLIKLAVNLMLCSRVWLTWNTHQSNSTAIEKSKYIVYSNAQHKYSVTSFVLE